MWMIKTETPEGKCVNIRKTLQTKPLVGTYLWKQINKYVHIKTQAHLWLLHCPMNCCKYFSLLCPRNHSLQDFYIYHCDKLRTSLQLLQENKRRTSVYTILYSMKNERSFILPYYENSQNIWSETELSGVTEPKPLLWGPSQNYKPKPHPLCAVWRWQMHTEGQASKNQLG